MSHLLDMRMLVTELGNKQGRTDNNVRLLRSRLYGCGTQKMDQQSVTHLCGHENAIVVPGNKQ